MFLMNFLDMLSSVDKLVLFIRWRFTHCSLFDTLAALTLVQRAVKRRSCDLL